MLDNWLKTTLRMAGGVVLSGMTGAADGHDGLIGRDIG